MSPLHTERGKTRCPLFRCGTTEGQELSGTAPDVMWVIMTPSLAAAHPTTDGWSIEIGSDH